MRLIFSFYYYPVFKIREGPLVPAANGSTNNGTFSFPNIFNTYTGGAVISNAGLTVKARSTNGNANVGNYLYFGIGKYYFEYTFTTASTWTSAGISLFAQANATAYSCNGYIYQYGTQLYSGWPNITAGNILCVAVDMVNKLIWFRINNGNWNNSSSNNPATGVGGISIGNYYPISPCASLYNDNDTITANFGGSSYAYTPPSGFTNWGSLTTNYNEVSESQWDALTYVTITGTSGQKELYTMSSLSTQAYTIFGVRSLSVANKVDAGPSFLKQDLVSNGHESVSSSVTVLTSWARQYGIFEVDPNTNAAWSPPAIASAQFGVKIA